MTYKMREIEKVELWNKPWFGNKLSETVEMSYEGKGEWSISDYEWYVTDGSNKDTRYYFICTYVDSFKERWAYTATTAGAPEQQPRKLSEFLQHLPLRPLEAGRMG